MPFCNPCHAGHPSASGAAFLWTVLLAVLSGGLLLPAAGNDAFADTWDFGDDLPAEDLRRSNAAATAEADEPDHAGELSHSLWYRWTAAYDETVVIETAGSDFDTVLAVYTGNSLAGLAEAASNDDADVGRTSRLVLQAEGGTTYHIAVDGFGDDTGLVDLAIRSLPPPANDDFVDAVVLELGADGVAAASGSSVAATTESGEPDHLQEASHSVWWRWTAPHDGSVTIDTVGSDFDTVLAVYTGTDVAGLTLVAENDDTGGNASEVTADVLAGTTWHIAVDGFAEEAGAVALRLAMNPPVNDDFADAIPLEVGRSYHQTVHNFGATVEAGEPDHGGNASHSVWWTWQPDLESTVNGSVGGSRIPVTMRVYTGAALGDLTLLHAFSDISPFSFGAGGGVRYWIAVDGMDEAVGTIDLQWTSTPNPPRNDRFILATDLGSAASATDAGHNITATSEAAEPDHLGQLSHSVWWRWTAPADGPVTIDTAGSSFDTVLAVYVGSDLASLTEVATNDDSLGIGRASRVTFDADAGTVYRIAVDGIADLTGAIALQVDAEPPVNDAFDQAIVLTMDADGQAMDTGSNCAASVEVDEPDHAGQGSHSVWWRWIAPRDGRLTIETVGSDFDTVVAVYTGEGVSTLSESASDDDGVGLLSRVTIDVEFDTVYHIAVDGSSTAVGSVALQLVLDPPVNDDFAHATEWTYGIRGGIGDLTDNIGATVEADEPDHLGEASHSLWWRWTAPYDCQIKVDTLGSEYDTVLGVYTGTALADLVEVASNDDVDAVDHWSRVVFDAVEGTTYHIAVDGADGQTGETIFVIEMASPTNDDFDEAVDLDGALRLEQRGHNVLSTNQIGEPDHAGHRSHSVWYRWTAPGSGTLAVQIEELDFTGVLALYTGTRVDDLTLVQQAADPEGATFLITPVVEGTTYHIAVDGRDDQTGRFDFLLVYWPERRVTLDVRADSAPVEDVTVWYQGEGLPTPAEHLVEGNIYDAEFSFSREIALSSVLGDG